jgi:Fe-S-cluster containining protein
MNSISFHMKNILENYRLLLSSVDQWFGRCLEHSPGEIKCARGCSECCRGLFDITLLDAWYLKTGFDRLDGNIRRIVLQKSEKRLKSLRQKWPDFYEPYILNVKPEEDWQELMPDDDETPCPLLSDTGKCLVYDYRPMTCRLHGIPLVDVSGEVFHDEWCSMNFQGGNPLSDGNLHWNFSICFQTELSLFQEFTYILFNQYISELDTFIPASLFMDYGRFDWKGWWAENVTKVRLAGFPGS